MNDMHFKYVNLIIGYLFLLVGCVGGLSILVYSLGFESYISIKISPFVHLKMIPIFPAALVFVGAYLVKTPINK